MKANTKQLRAMVKGLGINLWMNTHTELRGKDFENMHTKRKRYLRFGLLDNENMVEQLVIKAMNKLSYTNKWRINKGGYLSFNTWLL